MKSCARHSTSAGIARSDVDYINAHGTSTPQNDRVETLAIKQAFGAQAYDVADELDQVAARASGCAAGGVEALLRQGADGSHGAGTSRRSNLDRPDRQIVISTTCRTSRAAPMSVRALELFGFGGQNGTIAVRKWAA